MPQKRNPDAAELVRAKTGRIIGALTGLLVVIKGLPLAYAKDMQEDKEPLWDAIDTIESSLEATAGILEDIIFHRERLEAASGDEMLAATEVADLLVREGVPFREAHGIVGELVRDAIAAGADLVTFSGDKLLGGPQAGLLTGRRDAVDAARRHPLARAIRIDKLSLAALHATLALHREPKRAQREVPVLAMLSASESELAARARLIREQLGPVAEIVRTRAKVGGGALPLLELEGPAVALDGSDALAAALRAGDPPVIARIHEGRVLLDPRTLTDEDAVEAARVARAALR
jgi:seryl-tRNA(Sec) selenium transferase